MDPLLQKGIKSNAITILNLPEIKSDSKMLNFNLGLPQLLNMFGKF